MSFGASPSDIIIVVTFCRSLYRKCRDAGGEYDEISREVRGLHTVLKHLKYEVEAPESPLNRDHSLWDRQLAPIVGDCDFTLKQLDGLLQKYGRLSDGGGSPSSPRIIWDKIRFGSNEMDTLGTIRVKLISHKTSLTLFLDTIQLHQSGKLVTTLDNHGGQLDIILDKVDGIAARMGQRSGSIMTSYDDDDKEVWKQFRRELVAEGFSSDVLTQHKDVLRAYIREIDQKGLLDETPPQPVAPPQQPGVSPQHWLDNVRSPPPSEAPPPSFESLNTPTDDGSAKEMVVREENMKFPPSMKFERRRPETRHSDLQRELENLSLSRDTSLAMTPRTTPAVPRLLTSDEKDEKDIQYFNTDGSSDSDSDSSDSLKRRKSLATGLVIRTSDLFKSNGQGPKLLLPASPTSFRSSQGSFGEDGARSKSVSQNGTSPSRGGIPIPSMNARTSSEGFGTSPRAEHMRLEPDEHGNEILPDAKWTRINRRLVSPAILDQDHRRYEARPEWVAVLGVLSRTEIASLAARSSALRTSRLRPFPTELPPEKPPRPPMPIPRSISSPVPRSHDTQTSSSTETESEDDARRRRRRNRKRGSHTPPSEMNVPVSGYPNPFGQPKGGVPQPIWMATPPSGVNNGGIWVPASAGRGGMYYPPPSASYEKGKDNHREKERNGRHESRRHYSHHSKRDHGRDSAREKPQKVSRWKENLTAAGIGGAAASLLNVLTEAAEGL